MRRILSFCTLLFTATWSFGQDAPANTQGGDITCTQRLRLARATYEAGRLHELVGTILGDKAADCFKDGEGTFSTQEKVDALKLIILAYIYLEEPLKADEKMLELLRTDHFYEPDDNADPQEYLALYRTFRTDPIISITLKGGANVNLPTILKVYPVSEEVNAQYKAGYSYQVGLSFEKEFFPKAKMKALRNSELAGEIFYFSRVYKMTNDRMFVNIPEGVNERSTVYSYTASSTWLDLNALIKYHINPNLKIDPYVSVGPGFSYLLNADYDLIQTQHFRPDGAISATVTGPAVPEVKNAYFKFTTSAILSGGIKLRLGTVYLNAEARAQVGFRNLIDGSKRYLQGIQNDYGININDYRQTNFTLNVGVTVPIYNPKKLTRKK